MSSSMYDVAIIGGGPAGSTAAGLLARAGRRVILFEREKFPQFHIGESLLPFSMKASTRLGLHEKFLCAGFLKKYGGEIVSACSDTGTKFYFKDGYRSQTDHAYQVTRGDFDKVLLDHATESGAEVCEETKVDGVEFSKDADALNEVLNHPPKSKRLFGRYERSVNRAMNVYLRFVNAWYTKEFIEVFLAPRNLLGPAPAVNSVLGGNVGNSFQIR
jgi:flavin-dependent dehydrogenase